RHNTIYRNYSFTLYNSSFFIQLKGNTLISLFNSIFLGLSFKGKPVIGKIRAVRFKVKIYFRNNQTVVFTKLISPGLIGGRLKSTSCFNGFNYMPYTLL